MRPKLRIVGGTDYESAGTDADSPRPTAVKAAPKPRRKTVKPAPVQVTAALIGQAHAAVLACVLPDGATVEQSLRWLQGGFEVFDDDVQGEMGLSLMRVGIADNPTPEVGYDALGYVTRPEKLLAAYPHLRKYESILTDNRALPV